MNPMSMFFKSPRYMHQSFRFAAGIIIIISILLCTNSCSADWTATQWNERGKQYYTNGDYDSAIFAFLRSIAIDPIVATVWSNLGVAYEAKNMVNESQLAFRRSQGLMGRHDTGCCCSGIGYHMETGSGDSSGKPDTIVARTKDIAHYNGYSVYPST